MKIMTYNLSSIGIDKFNRYNLKTVKLTEQINKYCYPKVSKVKNLFNIISGYAFKSEDYCEDGVPLVRISDLNDNFDIKNMAKLPEHYYKEKKFQKYKVQKEDIIISLTGDGDLRCYYMNQDEQLLLNQRTAILRRKNKTINPFFYFWILQTDYFKAQFKNQSNGKSQLNISPLDLANLMLPEIDEDKQIQFLSKIDNILKEIEKYNYNIVPSQLIINEVFSKYFDYDKNIIYKVHKGMTYGTQKEGNTTFNITNSKLSEINDNKYRLSTRANNSIIKEIYKILNEIGTIQTKSIVIEPIHRGKSPKYDEKGEIPVIKTAHITNNGINRDFVEFVNEEFYDKKTDAQLKEGDILLTSTGKPSIGKIDIFKGDYKAIPDGHLSIIRIDENKYNPEFFVYFIRSVLGYTQLEKEYVGCTNQIELYADSINNIVLPDIKMDLQREIVRNINKQIEKQDIIIKQINMLKEEINLILENIINL